MNILGYSERGVINSLMYEIMYSARSLKLLTGLLANAQFPHLPNKPSFNSISNAEILVDHSLSDFGDADIVFLLEVNGQKITVFAEAKVKTAQSQSWSINREFQNFQKGIQVNRNEEIISNLFTQLYFKLELSQALWNGGLNQLMTGVPFPSWSRKNPRKIGKNPVVSKAVNHLLNYGHQTLYLAIVPDNPNNMSIFWNGILRNHQFPQGLVPHWNISHWGYLCWEDIHKFCGNTSLNNTCNVFNHNQGQIY